MKNNSFILLKEEKERIKKLYEATTAAASGSYNQPMGFSTPGLGGDVEVIDMENTFIDGDNRVWKKIFKRRKNNTIW